MTAGICSCASSDTLPRTRWGLQAYHGGAGGRGGGGGEGGGEEGREGGEEEGREGGEGEVKRREEECWARRTNEKHDQLCGNQGDPPLLSNSSHGIQQDWHHCVVEVSSSAERLHVHSRPGVSAGLTLTFQHFLQEETQNSLYRYPQPQRLPCDTWAMYSVAV